MRVFLVAVERPDGRRWHVSLDPSLRADLLYHAKRGAAVRLWRSVRPIPLGLALSEVRRLNGGGKRLRPIWTGWRNNGEPFLVPVESGHLRGPDRKAHGADELAATSDKPETVGSSHEMDGLAGMEAADRMERAMDRLAEAMDGRSLLAEEFESVCQSLGLGGAGEDWRFLAQWGILAGLFALRPAVMINRPSGKSAPRPGSRNDRLIARFGRSGAPFRKNRMVCLRCGADGRWMRLTFCASCGEMCPYCERCLTMGRARACTPLIAGTGMRLAADETSSAAAERGTVDAALAAVPGLSLSPVQEKAAREVVRFVLASRPGLPGAAVRSFLIWAVTGAGKTEMIFPLIAAERARGGRVAVATPRRDVVLELIPRISAAFPEEKVEGLYGGIGRRWPTGGIIVSTTHQLIRYESAFDLVVLDEVDAFPFHGDPMLAFAARKALKPGGAFVMLSATPPPEMQRAVRHGRLPCAMVPVRHHRQPLPVPVCTGPGKLVALLAQTLERGARAFVFVPRIARLEPELARLRKALAGVCPPGRIEATSSRDPMREDKVRRLRTGDIRILLTTTILERGVTIPKADVYVLEADHRLFDAAALVQMAGRAGRSAEDPAGRVVFLSGRRTREQRRAIREIRRMNRLARQTGYLAEPGDNGRDCGGRKSGRNFSRNPEPFPERGHETEFARIPKLAPEPDPGLDFKSGSKRVLEPEHGGGRKNGSADRRGWLAWRE